MNGDANDERRTPNADVPPEEKNMERWAKSHGSDGSNQQLWELTHLCRLLVFLSVADGRTADI